MNPADRLEYEESCKEYMRTYEPDIHTGWFAEQSRGPDDKVVVAERYDLEHPLQPGFSVFRDCIDCGANLQLRPSDPDGGLPVLCICCAYDRASSDT
jgi:hypothetical protein